jgi:hypothetical protein
MNKRDVYAQRVCLRHKGVYILITSKPSPVTKPLLVDVKAQYEKDVGSYLGLIDQYYIHH